jgi:DnaJ like chaperone protein
MIIWGKLIGVLVGATLFGQFGAVMGLMAGHLFDNGLTISLNASNHSALVRATFFKTVFQVMGHLAKIKGHVSENEINVARDIMQRDFKLNSAQMALAIQYFTEGKQPNFDLVEVLNRFKQVCGGYAELRFYFLELQLKLASANKILSVPLRDRLVFICNILGIPVSELGPQFQAHSSYTQNTGHHGTYTKSNNSNSYNSSQPKVEDPLLAAYKLLGVSANDNIKTIKSAYRRLISKYHPDKLVAKGLPPEMMNIAKEKTQQLTVAYDLIIRSRE